jgi:hypothetical protein
MIAYLFEALPFLFSIAVKAADALYSEQIAELIKSAIPYELSPTAQADADKKLTIADIAGDAHLRFTYMLTLCFSTVSAASITAKTNQVTAGLLLIVGFVFLIAFSFPFLMKPLGWLNVAAKTGGMRRGTKALVVLITLDVALMLFTLSALHAEKALPAPVHPAPRTATEAQPQRNATMQCALPSSPPRAPCCQQPTVRRSCRGDPSSLERKTLHLAV